jgi:hypothetical protein
MTVEAAQFVIAWSDSDEAISHTPESGIKNPTSHHP